LALLFASFFKKKIKNYFPNSLLIAVLFYNVNRKDAMMHKPILDDRKKELRGLTIHKNGAISSSKVCVKSTHMSFLNECLEIRRH
jgi:hypothetical protein